MKVKKHGLGQHIVVPDVWADANAKGGELQRDIDGEYATFHPIGTPPLQKKYNQIIVEAQQKAVDAEAELKKLQDAYAELQRQHEDFQMPDLEPILSVVTDIDKTLQKLQKETNVISQRQNTIKHGDNVIGGIPQLLEQAKVDAKAQLDTFKNDIEQKIKEAKPKLLNWAVLILFIGMGILIWLYIDLGNIVHYIRNTFGI